MIDPLIHGDKNGEDIHYTPSIDPFIDDVPIFSPYHLNCNVNPGLINP